MRRRRARADGVAAVWTARDVADLPPIDFRLTAIAGLAPYRQHVLAREFVRYVGEPVAAIFAAGPYRAEDAAALVQLDIAALAPCLDAAGPVGSFAPGLDSEPALIRKSYGDLDAAFAGAHRVVALDLAVGRHSGVPLETRGALAQYDAATDMLRMHGAAKVPLTTAAPSRACWASPRIASISTKRMSAAASACAASSIPRTCSSAPRRGSSGGRSNGSRTGARICSPPIIRASNFTASAPRSMPMGSCARSMTNSGPTRVLISAPTGRRSRTSPPRCCRALIASRPIAASAICASPTRRRAGTYRAPGRYESSFVRERLMDVVAAALGLDPIAVRRANLVPQSAMPFERGFNTLGTHVGYDSGDYAGLLDKSLARLDWPRLRAQVAARRERGECVGIGLGMFVEKSGLGPFDDARIVLDGEGRIEIVTGAASIGQGIETVMAQICADALGARFESITVTHGQTDRIARGMGAFASRVTVMTGSAVFLAAGKLRAALLDHAGRLLQAAADDLVVGTDELRGAAAARSTSPRSRARRAER